ncbi:MAG: hypothetical protein ACE5GY_00535 [Thermodesulfobacteriota bacterium]
MKKIRRYAAAIVPPVLIILWLAGFIPAFRAEQASLRIVPELLGMGSVQREALGGGPIYELTSRMASLIPPGSRIFFFNPPVASAKHYSGKARYYLYPTPIIEVNSGDNLKPSDFRNGDYLVFFIPRAFAGTSFEAELTSVVRSRNIYGVTGKKGRQAIYMVTG